MINEAARRAAVPRPFAAGECKMPRHGTPDMGQQAEDLAIDGVRPYRTAFRQEDVNRSWHPKTGWRNESLAKRRRPGSSGPRNQ